MKKTYKNVIGVALSSLLCLSIAIPANAQRGGDHTTTPPPASPPPAAPAPQPQRSAPAPAPQPQAQPQQQRPQQQQFQRGNSQPQQQAQRSNPPAQQQNSSQQRTNAVGSSNPTFTRGGQHTEQPQFRPVNPNNGTRRYPAIGQRPNNYNPRSGAFNYNRGNGYRSYPGLQYGKHYTSPRPQGFYYRNRGYYATYYTPQIGFRIGVLPYGYYPFSWDQNQYYYSDGLFYTQQDNNYAVVEPPVGASIDKLPSKAQAIAINGMQYYELNGVYYQPVTRDDGSLVYQIAGKDGELTTADAGASPDDLPQVGDLVDNLPEGCKILRLNGQKYYVSQEGYYFQEAVDTNGDKVFKIVGTPTDEPGN
jgi:hypothetical protein